MHAAFGFIKRTYQEYSDHNGGSYAAAIAYYMLFSIFPLAIVLLAFGGYFLSNAQRDQLVIRLTDALGGGVGATVRQQVEAVSHGRAGIGVLGLLGALWSATSVFNQVRTGLGALWDRQHLHAWPVWRALDLVAMLGLYLMLGLSVAAGAALSAAQILTTHVFGSQVGASLNYALRAGFVLLPIALMSVTFALLYIWASPPRIGWRHVWPGALFGAVGVALLSAGFSYYTQYIAHFSYVYGTLGAAVAFLFYAYLFGALILFGAEIVEQSSQRRRGAPRHL